MYFLFYSPFTTSDTIRYTSGDLHVTVAKNMFLLPMTYFVIPLRYTENINSFIVWLHNRKRYEYELEKQMERRMERIRKHEFARFFYFHKEGKVGDCYSGSDFYGRHGV